MYSCASWIKKTTSALQVHHPPFWGDGGERWSGWGGSIMESWTDEAICTSCDFSLSCLFSAEMGQYIIICSRFQRDAVQIDWTVPTLYAADTNHDGPNSTLICTHAKLLVFPRIPFTSMFTLTK